MNIFQILLFFATFCYTATLPWETFKNTFNKSYSSAIEDELRRRIYEDNLSVINSHNAKYEAGTSTFKMDVNQYADMTNREFLRFVTGHKMSLESHRKATSFVPSKFVNTPPEIDWVELGAVTPVKDQGFCAASWAFAIVGSSLTVVMIMAILAAMEGILKMPYAGKKHSCNNNAKAEVNVTGFVQLPFSLEEELLIALATIGPLVSIIDASSTEFQLYSEGIYNNPRCSSIFLNHAILITGYGTTGGTSYWKFKNSWGNSWGEDGFGKILRGETNHCGISSKTSYPML